MFVGLVNVCDNVFNYGVECVGINILKEFGN